MLWGSFGTVHILSLVLGAGLMVGLYFLLRCFSAKIQTIVLGILSFAGIAAIIFNLVTWGSPYEYLPLHLCSLTAMALPFAVFTRSKVLSNLLLLWSLGAVMALVVNTAQANFEILSPTFFFYFFPHLLEFGIPILLFRLGLVEKDVKCILSTLLITLCVFTLIHFANVALNSYFVAHQVLNPAGEVIQVNYMYSIKPENPVLALFWSLIPAAFWYMLPVMLIVMIYLAAVYAKQIVCYFKAKKR
ncbi:MAG: YwaF family protein [Oscillospiraceae bacterium]|nr:YwaF family protein [Oscillospiraceae bacterium]